VNLREALKSGKRFKSKSFGIGRDYHPPYHSGILYQMFADEIVADDFEIEEEKITISMTKSEWWEMVRDSMIEKQKEMRLSPVFPRGEISLEQLLDSSLGLLAKKLGFG
jgi:hypothetical protein